LFYPNFHLPDVVRILLAIMSPRNEVFQAAAPFDTYSDAKELLIATSADAEKEDQGLDEKALSSFKRSSLVLGLLIGFFFQFSALGANCLAMGNGWVGGGKDFVMKSTIDIVGFSFLWNLFTLTTLVLILVFIRNLVTIAYLAAGGRSEELLDDMVWQLQCHFGVGTVAGVCLAWTIMDLILCSLAIMVVVLYWYKVTMASATHSKPSSTRPSTAEQTPSMMIV
jgi:hypothetical protein